VRFGLSFFDMDSINYICKKLLGNQPIHAVTEFKKMVGLVVKCKTPFHSKKDIEEKDQAVLEFFQAEGGLFSKICQLIAQSDTSIGPALRKKMEALFTEASDPVPFAELEEQLTDASQKMKPGVLDVALVAKEHMAVASIAQVHAVGDDKIVKVSLRRNRKRFAQQLEFLKELGRFGVFSSGKLALCDKIGEGVVKEFAMDDEAEILTRASEAFDKLGEEVCDVSVPKVLGSTPEVLVMERVVGRHLKDLMAPSSGSEDKALALKAVKNLFIFQGACVFKSGLVHCDPHSGNILVNINGHTYALDWGCRAELSVEFQNHLKVIFANLPHIKASTSSAPSARHQERCAEVAKSMRSLGFTTKKDTDEGLTIIALQTFDSSEPPSLTRVDNGTFGSEGDRGDISNVSSDIVNLMRMISLLGGLARNTGNDELNTLRLWSSHVNGKRKSTDEGSEDTGARKMARRA